MAFVTLASCAEAGGELRGGELTDAGQAATNPPAFTPDTGAADPGPDCVSMGTTWTAIYTELFGPTGRPGSCTYRGNCHGPGEVGTKTASGLKCFDQQGCRQSLFDTGVLEPKDSAAPENSRLFVGLLRIRKPDGSTVGFMPQIPADYVLPQTCVERVQTWIRNGAQDD